MSETLIDPMKDICEGLDWLKDRVLPAHARVEFLKDQVITEALMAIQPLWTKEEIRRRCLLVRCVGSQIEELFVDGVMVVQFEPPETSQEWKEDRLVITCTQKFKRIQSVKVAKE